MTTIKEAIDAAATRFAAEVRDIILNGVATPAIALGHMHNGTPYERAINLQPKAKRASKVSPLRVAEEVRKHALGVRAEDLRKTLGAPKAAFQRAVKAAIADGSVKKKGEKRATRYYAAGK